MKFLMMKKKLHQKKQKQKNCQKLNHQRKKKLKSKKKKVFDKADLDKDGIVTEAEKKAYYESDGWRNSYQGKPYYQHPWFDWTKRERWINDRKAINFWINNRGGSQHQLEKIKEQYPTDFTKKTY